MQKHLKRYNFPHSPFFIEPIIRLRESRTGPMGKTGDFGRVRTTLSHRPKLRERWVEGGGEGVTESLDALIQFPAKFLVMSGSFVMGIRCWAVTAVVPWSQPTKRPIFCCRFEGLGNVRHKSRGSQVAWPRHCY